MSSDVELPYYEYGMVWYGMVWYGRGTWEDTGFYSAFSEPRVGCCANDNLQGSAKLLRWLMHFSVNFEWCRADEN